MYVYGITPIHSNNTTILLQQNSKNSLDLHLNVKFTSQLESVSCSSSFSIRTFKTSEFDMTQTMLLGTRKTKHSIIMVKVIHPCDTRKGIIV